MSKKLNIEENAKKVIEKYTGLKVKRVDIHYDPIVDGCYAMRVIIDDDDQPVYFLKDARDKKLTVDTIEEIKIESWPPPSGNLKFF